jgi:serine/threonine protein kinase
LIQTITDGGRTLSKIERLLLCSRLSEAVDLLESSGLSHRDLSHTNVIVDPLNIEVSLIDWDGLYHSSLPQQPNATVGANGYISPFVRANGSVESHRTWREHADRFALAVLNTELLTVNSGSRRHVDGGLFDQAELYARAGQSLFGIKNRLRQFSLAAAILLDGALNATSFEQCPSPVAWLEVINQELKKGAESVWSEEETEDTVTVFTRKYEPHFVEIDQSAFVTIDSNVFVKAPGRRQH